MNTTTDSPKEINAPQEKTGGGWMRRLVGHLFRCRHDWSITGCNGFGHPSEEQCIKCGEYRHRVHDHRMIGLEEWKSGKHPKSK
jgi:hypothetical protein